VETVTLRYLREKECKGSVRFEEQPENGRSLLMPKIYVQRPFSSDAAELEVTVRITKPT